MLSNSTARKSPLPVQVLTPDDRHRLLAHLLALGREDRYLRFGSPMSDGAITTYVNSIRFSSDNVFGVFDNDLNLVAAAHFARMPCDADHAGLSAELGLSVAASHRSQGLGTVLLERCALHARNLGIQRLFIHCLTQNQAMMRIARRAGMHISFAGGGEADAFVELQPSDVASVFGAAMADQVAAFDYALKRQLAAFRRWNHLAA